jgi:peptidoglycan/xylan/chitin deacetylase (PgdA/CDA1 family)
VSDRTTLLNVSENMGQPDRAGPSKEGPYAALGGQHERKCVLTYHEILPSSSPYLYRVTSAQFQAHVSLLSSKNFQSISLNRAPLITFDDGHWSNFQQAFPLLEQYGLKATFFVLAGCVGATDKYISWDQARQMVAAGHRVESHGWSHRLLTQCSPDDLEKELVRSKREIEDRLGAEVSAISAPGGRWDERVADACAHAGYKYLFHSNPWAPADYRNNLHLQGRHMVTGRTGPKELQKLVQAGGTRRLYSRVGYEAKERVRTMLGDKLYHKLWCWLAKWSAGEGLELEVDTLTNNKRESRNS